MNRNFDPPLGKESILHLFYLLGDRYSVFEKNRMV